MADTPRKVVYREDLPKYGVNYSKSRLNVLIKEKKFPPKRRVHPNARKGFWFEDEVVAAAKAGE